MVIASTLSDARGESGGDEAGVQSPTKNTGNGSKLGWNTSAAIAAGVATEDIGCDRTLGDDGASARHVLSPKTENLCTESSDGITTESTEIKTKCAIKMK